MKRKSFLVVFGLVGVTVLSATPVIANQTDSRIESAARNSYVFKTYLKNDDVHVSSQDGVVTLTGSVANSDQKSMAGETVSNLPDVKSVNNDLSINRNESPVTGSDAWLELKIKSALLFDRGASAGTKVVARNGVVTLYGPAENQAQKDLMTHDVREVDGVRHVINDMSVPSAASAGQNVTQGQYAPRTLSQKIDDASVTAEVKMSLAGRHSLNGSDIHVKTHNGEVTLTGTAPTEAQKQLAGQIVNGLRGVDRVDNDVTVQQ